MASSIIKTDVLDKGYFILDKQHFWHLPFVENKEKHIFY